MAHLGGSPTDFELASLVALQATHHFRSRIRQIPGVPRQPIPGSRIGMDHANSTTNRPTVEELEEALRVYRRLLVFLLAVAFVGFPTVVGLSFLGTWLRPPYGLHIAGWTLTEWGFVLLVVGLLAYLWITGRKLGRLLDDRTLLSFPIVGIMSGLQVVAQHAHARGLKWGPFLGPLRPSGR